MEQQKIAESFRELEAWSKSARLAAGGLVGQSIAGRYEIVEKIGQGGMAVLYLVSDVVLGEPFVIKIIRPEVAIKDINRKRFKQEARAAQDLNHPNIVAVHAYDISPDGYPFMVMDYVDGFDLGKIQRLEALSIKAFFEIFTQVTSALVHAHSRGVVHRDVKPSNILVSLTKDGKLFAKLVDFGIAKLIYPMGEQTQVMTSAGQTVGSPAYMSPEQAQGKKIDIRSDIYSLGCVMFEAISCQLPFKGATAVQLAMQHVSSPAPALTGLTKRCPHNLDRVIQHCLAKNPDLRYQNMFDLRNDLSLVASGEEPLLGTGETEPVGRAKTSLFEFIKGDVYNGFNCVFEGRLSYDVRLNSVLARIYELAYPGDSVLRLESSDPAFVGMVLFRDGRRVIAARIIQEGIIGYHALRKLLALADGDFKYFILARDDLTTSDPTFVLNLKHVLALYPNLPASISELPESPSLVVNQGAFRELMHAMETDSSLNAITDASSESAGDLYVEMEGKQENWKPVARKASASATRLSAFSDPQDLSHLVKDKGGTTGDLAVHSGFGLFVRMVFSLCKDRTLIFCFVTALTLLFLSMNISILRAIISEHTPPVMVKSGKKHSGGESSANRRYRRTTQHGWNFWFK
ncbi:MAG: serine/threonine protein kinase [Candidatus Obscuribacterales bacterium]|nr:serine/threonine protein kinase [Candidatus Obscuribacterales bacterium]